MGVSIWEGSKAQELIDAINNTQKVDKQQGTANAGKALVVGSDGLVGFGNAGMSDRAKAALLGCFQHVYLDEGGKQAYNELYRALYNVQDIYGLLYTVTGFQKVIGYIRDDGTGYITDASEIAACAYLGNYTLQVGDKIKLEDESGLYLLRVGTNNPNASSDGKYTVYVSNRDGAEYVISEEHLSDCKVADVRKLDGSNIANSELDAISQIVKIYRKEEQD